MGEIIILFLVAIPFGIFSFVSWELGSLKDEINKGLEDLRKNNNDTRR